MMMWQESWDRLMAAYQPNRGSALEAVLDLIDAAHGGPSPRILDLGGGTGETCRRALRRWPRARLTLLDIDPVLMAIAEDQLPTVELVRADLSDPDWTAKLPHRDFDAVIAVMALHYFPPDRLTGIYAEIVDVLRPGGLLVNVDHMPDPGLAGLSTRLVERGAVARQGEPDWQDWWSRVADDPDLGPTAAERERILGERKSAEWTPPVTWHSRALRAAGYGEVGLGWRRGPQAALVAVREHANGAR